MTKYMKTYELFIYDNDELIHNTIICAENNFDALDSVFFQLKHHAKYDGMRFEMCRIFDISNSHDKYIGEEIAVLIITDKDILK